MESEIKDKKPDKDTEKKNVVSSVEFSDNGVYKVDRESIKCKRCQSIVDYKSGCLKFSSKYENTDQLYVKGDVVYNNFGPTQYGDFSSLNIVGSGNVTGYNISGVNIGSINNVASIGDGCIVNCRYSPYNKRDKRGDVKEEEFSTVFLCSEKNAELKLSSITLNDATIVSIDGDVFDSNNLFICLNGATDLTLNISKPINSVTIVLNGASHASINSSNHISNLNITTNGASSFVSKKLIGEYVILTSYGASSIRNVAATKVLNTTSYGTSSISAYAGKSSNINHSSNGVSNIEILHDF